MKVLECNKCHRLFKASNDHITLFVGGHQENYCTSCTDMFLGYLHFGMIFGEHMEASGIGGVIIEKFKDKGQEGDVYDD